MALPDLNSPEEQARVQAEAEAKRAAAAAANAPTGVEQGAVGDAADAITDTTTGAIDDFFSAEQVAGPAQGGWGASGTAAAGYNANAVNKGLTDQQHLQGTGNNLYGGAHGTSRGLMTASSLAGQRETPDTSWAGAELHSTRSDGSRGVANELVNQAGSSTQQDAQLSALNAFANSGPGESAAQAQLAGAGDAAQRSALSMARSGRGAGDSASALRDATFSNAATQATTGQNMAQLRAQEEATFRGQQLEALNAAMGGAGAIRGADVSAAQVAQGTRAQDLQAQSQAADQAKFDTTTGQNQQQINDSAQSAFAENALGFEQLGQQSLLGFEQLGSQTQIDNAQLGQNALNAQSDYELQREQMKIDAQIANQQADLEKDSGISGMIGAAAGVMGLSDERAKELEKRESVLADAFGELNTLGNAPASSYRYKNPDQPGAAHGRQISSMAQDLERGPRGDEIVSETPQGKMVNYEAVVKMTPGAITELNHKVDALESAFGKKRKVT